MVADAHQPPNEPILFFLKVGRFDNSFALSAFDIEEDPCIIAAPSPRLCSAPIDLRLIKLCGGTRFGLEREVSFLLQPLVDAEGAKHGLRTMVRNDEGSAV